MLTDNCFRYDQTLFEDEQKNRMMETKELFEWVLRQECFEVFFSALFIYTWSIVFKDYLFHKITISLVRFWVQKTSFMLFLNKFDIFEKKVLKVSVDGEYYNTLG